MRLPNDFVYAVLDSLSEGVYFVDTTRRITYWSQTAERLTGYRAEDVIGRLCSHNILRHIDDKGRSLCLGHCALSESMLDGEPREQQMYLQHATGHRVPVMARIVPMRDASGQIVGAAEIFRDLSEQVVAERRLNHWRHEALVDPLTQIGNRRACHDVLETRLQQQRRRGDRFGIVFFDLDHFKELNDRHGHTAGDAALRVVARTLASNMRAFDVVGRWGGEEFLVIVACEGRDELRQLAERLCHLIGGSRIDVGPDTVSVTASGGASMARLNDGVDALLGRADTMLYESKRRGRNRICVTDDDAPAERSVQEA